MKYLILSVLIISYFTSCDLDDVDKTVSKEYNFDREIDSILSLMELEEKVGQMVLFTTHWEATGPTVTRETEQLIREGKCGNVFNAHDPVFNSRLQDIAVNESRMGIPLLFGYDVIHGYRTAFPIPLGEAASWDTILIREVSEIAAEEASSAGVTWTFAPMVDIALDPRWGRIAESATEDPFLTSVIAEIRVEGFQGDDLSNINTLLACVKHFAAYGAAQAGRDYHTVDISERMLREVYLPPFKAAVEADVASVMTSFNEIAGTPVTASKWLLNDILREEWGFQGFIVTDYTSINELIPHGVAADLKEAVLMAVQAGVDMDLEGGAYLKHLPELVEEGKVSEERINESVRRILQAKFKLGLFEDPWRYFDTTRQNETLLAEEHLEKAYEMACNSMVLLKNGDDKLTEGNASQQTDPENENDEAKDDNEMNEADQKDLNRVLPLQPGSNIALIGPHATLERDLLGSWIAAGKWRGIETILDAMRENNEGGNLRYARGCGFDDTDRSGFNEALNAARASDIIVLTMGEPWHWSGEAASRTSIRLPEIQTELISELSALNKPIVLVLLNGRPLALEDEYEMTDAILEAWFPGTMGAQAIADVLYGKYNPSGKLPVTFPRNLGQVPIHYNVKNTGRPYEPEGPEQKYRSRYLDSPNDPLFPFGFGLTYTRFNYEDIILNSDELSPEAGINVSINVSNEGEYAGSEVVQLYIRDLVGSVTRPVKELKAFRKIYLEPGQTEEVSFHLDSEDLAFYRADMTYGPEPGEFMIFVGGNSRDVVSSRFIYKED